MDTEKILKFCRICVLEKPDLVKITQTFESGGVKSTLKEIFNDCSPVKIETSDGLPDKFCMSCLGELLKTYEFRQKCRKATLLFEAISKSLIIKRKCESSPQQGPSSSKVAKLNNIDYENVIIKNEIIFHELSDDEDEDDPKHCGVEGDEVGTSEIMDVKDQPVLTVKVDTNSKQIVSAVKYSPAPLVASEQSDEKAVYVPQSREKIALSEKPEHPDLGEFRITVLRGYKNSSHVVYEANGFLYVNTRNTSARRYLRCSTSRNCPGKACIDVKPENELEEFLYVYKLHNHPKETLHITKLRFLEEMRTIAAAGNYPPKQVYGMAIRNFPELKSVMPYTTLSSRLYRLSVGANSHSHSIDSLKKFGVHLMINKPLKYCKTREGEQFFQEALIDEDNGTCSLIYTNTALIESMSWSNEIFVDSSFKVNFDSRSNYYFLTICISVNEHRFPVFFALMDAASQEEYTKILTLFKDKYAPSLHPEEIVTDFDASLFKALSNVYKHATISGSLVHYIFHVYKQCNVEDIVKEIELKAECMRMQSNIFSLPILPPQLIPAGLNHLIEDSKSNGTYDVFSYIFKYIEGVWIEQVTPHVFSSFCNMSSVNENIVNTYKKMRDIISSNKRFGFFDMNEKLLVIEDWVSNTHQKVISGEKLPRQFASSKYEKVLDRLWQQNQIEKFGFSQFFESVCPLIEKMTGLIWIWGFYNYTGLNNEPLITPHDYFGTEYIEQVMETSEEVEEAEPAGDVIGEDDNHEGMYGEIIEAECEGHPILEEVEQGEGHNEEQVITLQFIKPGVIIQKD